MGRFVAFLYGILAYAVFFVAILYGIGFVTGLGVAKTIDTGRDRIRMYSGVWRRRR